MPKGSKSPKSALSRFELDAIDQRMLTLELKYPAITDLELGKAIGLSRRHTNNRRNQEKYKRARGECLQEPIDIIKSNLREAAKVLVESLHSSDERIRLSAAKTILISECIIKPKPDIPTDDDAHEPLIIEMPLSGKKIIAGLRGQVERAVVVAENERNEEA